MSPSLSLIPSRRCSSVLPRHRGPDKHPDGRGTSPTHSSFTGLPLSSFWYCAVNFASSSITTMKQGEPVRLASLCSGC